MIYKWQYSNLIAAFIVVAGISAAPALSSSATTSETAVNQQTKAEQNQETEKDYCQRLNRQPDSASLHFAFGNFLTGMGRSREALKHYQKSVELKPDNPKYQSALGLALYKAKDY